MSEYKPPRQVIDNIYKTIFGEPELFIEFLENFVPIDILKNLSPNKIEDVTERHLPLFTDSKDSDTIKKITLDDNENIFVISVLEHESEVNYTSSFKLFQYISYILAEYVKENDKKYHEEVDTYGSTKLKLSTWKDFKYPPVFPIVFYDGAGEWTSETNFLDKTEMKDVFHKYIPKFEYELVNLSKYSQGDLLKFNNALSLLLIVDKVRTAEDIKKLRELPEQFVEEMAKKVPEHFLKIFRDCIELLLKKINAPKEEIEEITKKIYERRFNSMFEFIDGYDVQATRREARAEADKEIKEYKDEIKEYKDEIKRLKEELEKYKTSKME